MASECSVFGKFLFGFMFGRVVEKLWRSMFESWWESCGIFVANLWKRCLSTKSLWEKFSLWKRCGLISTGFYTTKIPCYAGGFAHFPQSLLLQLLII